MQERKDHNQNVVWKYYSISLGMSGVRSDKGQIEYHCQQWGKNAISPPQNYITTRLMTVKYGET